MVKVHAGVHVGSSAIGIRDAPHGAGYDTIFARHGNGEHEVAHGVVGTSGWNWEGTIFGQDTLRLKFGKVARSESLCDNARV